MKTKPFLILRMISHLSDLFCILVSLAYTIHFFINIQIFSIEAKVMFQNEITLYRIAKILIFLNIFTSLLTFYSFNLGSKTMMKFSTYFSILSQILGCCFIYYFNYAYLKIFKTTIDKSIYFYPNIYSSIQALELGGNLEDKKDKYFKDFVREMDLFIFYEIICIISLLFTFILIMISRKVKVSKEESIVPVIKEISKIGLNTVSLRTKRVVDVVK